MEKKQDSLDYWLEEVQEKETYKFMYSKFLLKQMPLEVQEDEGMFAQVLNYGTKVLVSAVQHRHPETQCSRVIREAKRQVWKWKKELCDELPHATVEYYEENLAECALCVAWGILYLECRDEPRTAFLNQMLRIWKTQWSCYESVFGGEWTDKTKLDIMHDLVKERKQEEKKKEDAQRKAKEEYAKISSAMHKAILGPSQPSNQDEKMKELQQENEQLRTENETLKTKLEQQEAAESGGELNEGGKYPQFTNRQLVILFQTMLNVTLKAEKGETPVNIKAFSDFIGMVSGRSGGSIRTTVNKGINYDQNGVKKDVGLLVEKMKVFNDAISQRLIAQIEEESVVTTKK